MCRGLNGAWIVSFHRLAQPGNGLGDFVFVVFTNLVTMLAEVFLRRIQQRVGLVAGFGHAATFYVLPGADPPNRLFNQPELVTKKLAYLAANGYEIGNHTLWHANLSRYPEPVVRNQIATAQEWVQRHVPGYRLRTLALPIALGQPATGQPLTAGEDAGAGVLGALDRGQYPFELALVDDRAEVVLVPDAP